MQIVRIATGTNEAHSADLIGAKAANLERMAALGLPVPPAFVLPITLCSAILRSEPEAEKALVKGLEEGIAYLEEATGRRFGDHRHPLLISVRSGAARSMPGMLETVLDVGCTPSVVLGLVRQTGHPRFAWDCRCRFLDSYADVVLGLDQALLRKRRDQIMAEEGVLDAGDLDSEALERLAGAYLQVIESNGGFIPEEPMRQVEAAARMVFGSWESDKAKTYRKLEHLEALGGTAVTVQAMVFGNVGLTSGAGVAFSRDPSTGAATPVIDVLFESQGEDVVSGRRTPEPEAALARTVPAAAKELVATLARLEQAFGDVQDVEFTIENGKLWFLQTRSAKRTPAAALRFAVAFVKEGLITPKEALQRLENIDFTRDIEHLANQRLSAVGEPVGHGTGASTGVAIGRAAFDSTSAQRLAKAGDPVILLRPEISTADVAGFAASAGIVTAVGGRTAHAALVARQLGKPCLVGCAGLNVDVAGHTARLHDLPIKEGDWLSIDGGAGTIFSGRGKLLIDRPEAELSEIARWKESVPA
ncbi:PEP/pyruvate-binding domain-containing protein [Beijerinckia indica]|uniref:Pyruvate phosphate dikinase PEP/pyruvate-binding n=1 Tax=Beijerinckia indica subsp. indica (strain ATCC 9039 / DSM 1715 / NCIMB 8712) TaxID=395963 RepID=B2IC59_BEII9|nr:PEP/pyruvate-binding domain-containing protein [Beijerinckia indica]ACB96656.1 pyruvate phosphate dikinase PEP/pyruvate-binding [Beijerinckia indica subsp. indica ATCC 9039]